MIKKLGENDVNTVREIYFSFRAIPKDGFAKPVNNTQPITGGIHVEAE